MSAGWKKKVRSGKRARRMVRSFARVGGGRPVLRLERDQDLAVGRRHERRVAEGQVDAAGGEADVVEDGVDLVGRDRLADHVLDLGEAALGLLEARAGRGADVQAELPGVDRREEVHADQPEEAEGDRHEAREDAGDDARGARAPTRGARRSRPASARSGG